MGKGGGGTDETRGLGGGREIKGEDGRGWRWGALGSVSSGGTRWWRGAAGDSGGGDGVSVGRHVREARGSRQRAAEIDERGSRQCRREGRMIPCKMLGEFGSRGHAGAMMMLAFEIFYLSRILSSAQTSLILLKCMYSHCIVRLKLAFRC
jgi:hypothetical protein